MNNSCRCPEPALAPGDIRHGFRVINVEKIPEIRVTAYELEHDRTGARVLHLHCDDRENLFAIGFRTPPKDSTGAAHILEHSVLAGSESFPLKDAFNELSKGSLQTFINAFTYPDKTVYPVASQVRPDFFNLARVYTDLVFRPRLREETLAQEGHHLEFENPADTGSGLTISGIVYNEMKGAYSSPDSIMYKVLQQGLYPDCPYFFDSGGDPDVIPTLTYEQFKAFHRIYYSPTNARVFLYGDIPTEDLLAFLEGVFSGFDRVEVDSDIASQPRWAAPHWIHDVYPVGEDDPLAGKTSVNVAWMTADNTDHREALLLGIVSQVLVGSAAGPLRKALIDSGLGEDLSPVTGLERDLKQVAFAVGLRGTDPEKAASVEAIVMDTLRRVADRGFDPELIEGALHQVEFHGKEIVRSHMPYGIVLMGRVFHTWLYDGPPIVGLRFSRTIEEIRDEWKDKPDLLQQVVRKWFIDNHHRLVSVMEPSRSYAKEKEAAFREKMGRLKAGLDDANLNAIQEAAARLRAIQAEPDTQEALATLPRLERKDIPRTIERVPTEVTAIEGVPALQHDVFANGIAYLNVAFDLSDIPEAFQPYLPLLGKLTTGMGAAGRSYEDMARRIALKTGGLGYRLAAGLTIDGRASWQKLIFSVKALHRNVLDAVAILAEVLAQGDLANEARMRDLVAEAKNRLHASVVPSGHSFARRTAASAFSVPAYRREQWHGRLQLRLLKKLAETFEKDKETFRQRLEQLRRLVFRKDRMELNLTGDGEGLKLAAQAAARLAACLETGGRPGTPSEPQLRPVRAGVSIPAQVCYVAKVLPAPTFADDLAAPLLVLSRELSTGYLYNRIRVQGGAYGGMCQYDPMNGQFSFMSYRDPHLVETLDVYEAAIDDVAERLVPSEELDKAVMGTIGGLDKPMDPSSKGYTAMIRHFAGLTDPAREAMRNAVLEMTSEQLQAAAMRCLVSARKSAAVAVYAAAERLREANEVLRDKLQIEPLL